MEHTRHRIYIAGPMNPRNSGGAIEYLHNCNNMIDVARELIKMGFAPFCQAVDMLYFLNGSPDESPSSQEIKDVSIEWLKQCEAMLLMPGWRESPGTLAEIDVSSKLGPMPIFTEIEKLVAYFYGDPQ
jgi:hypothetical protein